MVEYISNSEIDKILFQIEQTALKAVIENYTELDNQYLKLAFATEIGFEKLKEFINKNNLKDNPKKLTHGLLLINISKKIGLEPQIIAYVNKENPVIDDNFNGYLRCMTTNIIPISNKIINKIKQKRKQIKQFKSNLNSTNGLFIESDIFFNKDLGRNSKIATLYNSASSYAAIPIRIHPIIMSIVFHHYKKLKEKNKTMSEIDDQGLDIKESNILQRELKKWKTYSNILRQPNRDLFNEMIQSIYKYSSARCKR